MYKTNHLIATAIGMFALVAVAVYGCQTQDGSLPTEAERSVELSATPEEADAIFKMIADIITDPTLGKSAKKQFTTVVRTYPTNPANGKAKAKSLIAFIFKHYQDGKWVDDPETEPDTGDLVAAINTYVGGPATEAAEACIPNVPCQLVATIENEFAGAQIPGGSITQPFIIYLIARPDITVTHPIYGLVFDIGTIPEGITFPASPSGSLTLAAEDDQPVAAVCTLESPDPLGVPAGTVDSRLHVVHLVGEEWVRLPQIPVTFLDCSSASSETEASLWMKPFEFALDMVSPNALVAGGRGLGGAISSFSIHATELAPPFPTTTTLSVVSGGPVLHPGESITLRGVVDPVPPDAELRFLIILDPLHGGATTAALVSGVAEHTFVCGTDPHLPVGGTYTAQGVYLGDLLVDPNFDQSPLSESISFSCVEESD